MTYRPLVSIITLTYNHANFIRSCLSSVRRQTYTNWEQIVVDDGSQDGTPRIVPEYLDSRTHFIQGEHKGITGLAEACNAALAVSHGELVAILDGDDLWSPTKLANQVPLFEQADVVLSWGRGVRIDEHGRVLGTMRAKTKGPQPIHFRARELLPWMFWGNPVAPASGALARRETLQNAGGFYQPKGLPIVDMATWFRLILRMKPEDVFAYTNQSVTYYRVHPNQMASNYEFMLASRAQVLSHFLDELETSEPKRSPRLLAQLAAAISYYEARSAIAVRDWERARGCLRACWRGESLPVSRQVLFATVWYLLRFDAMRSLPSQVRVHLP